MAPRKNKFKLLPNVEEATGEPVVSTTKDDIETLEMETHVEPPDMTAIEAFIAKAFSLETNERLKK